MILPDRIAHAVAAGEVTEAYRRWTRLRIGVGSTFRSSAGVISIAAVEQIDPNALREIDARASGYPTLEHLSATFRGAETDPLYRISLRWEGADPRTALADDVDLTPADIEVIEALLNRLDAHTPWARTTLALLFARPGSTAAVLAADLPIEKESLKRRMRELKEHGLTRSLTVGYELSDRGRAFYSRPQTEQVELRGIEPLTS